MVNERSRTLVRCPMELNQHPLDLEEVALKRVKETASLEVLGRCADGDTILLDDVANAIPVSSDGTEAEEPEGRVATVGGREDGCAEGSVTGVSEYRGEFACCSRAGGRIFSGGVEFALDLALEKAVEGIQVPERSKMPIRKPSEK